MQKRTRLISLFSWKAKSGNISTLPQQPNSESSLAGKLFDSISTLTMDRFIKCACDGDMSQLFIDENEYRLTPKVIQVWSNIHEAFLDGMNDKAGMYKLRLIGQINHLEFVYKLIQICVQYLSVAYDPEILQHLQKHVLVGAFNPEDAQGYVNDLRVVLARAQGILATIEEKNAELSIIQKQETPGEKTSRKQFDQLISQVSIFVKFHIDKKETSVSEFIEYYTARRETNEALEDQYKNKK